MGHFPRKYRQVFIAYSGRIAFEYVQELAEYIKWAVKPFYDKKLRAYPWEPQLREEFGNSEAAVALVDSNFINSNYVSEIEAPQLLARNLRGEIPVVAISVSMVSLAVERRTYEVAAANDDAEKHTLRELLWVPREVQDDGERHYRAKPLGLLENKVQREYRYREILEVLLDEFDHRDHEAPKPPLSPPTPPGSPDSWRERFTAISAALLGWTRTIKRQWISRPQLDALAAGLSKDSSQGSTHLLLGPPGSGKSAFLAELGHRLQDQDWTVFALKADELSASTESSEALTHELDLPAEASTLIKTLASEGRPCLVLLDQLDSLASMVEQHTGRLDVLIELIVALHGHSHVHVVASSRNYEHDYDPRLRGLAAERIELGLPDAETIREFIHSHSELRFEPDAKILTLLRTPHNLRLLLEHPEIGAEGLDDPYELVALIAERVLGPNEFALAEQLAAQMGEHEELFLRRNNPSQQTYAPLLQAKARFVEERGDELRFTHQLVFEYFWARGAVERGLVEVFAKGSQTTEVRPRLRIVLRYLRSRGLATFYDQLDTLWAADEFHRHLRSLIITFVASQSPPTTADARWVVNRSQEDAWRAETLRQLAEPAWFELLEHTIDSVMQRDDDDALSVSRILGVTVAAHPERVLELLRKHWLVEERVRQLQFRLRDFTDPSPALVDAWIETTAFAGCDWFMILGFFSDRPGHPRHAAAVAGSYAAKYLAELAREIALLDEGYARFSRLERGLELLELPGGAELFEGASGVFLRRIWHAMSALLGTVEPRDEARWRTFRIAPDRSDRLRSSLIHILWEACIDFAKTEPAAFAAFARSYGMVDSGTLQGAVCAGIQELATHKPDLALALLVEEPRRLMLGSRIEHEAPRLARAIISQASQAAAPQSLERLSAAILALEPSADTELELRGPMEESLGQQNKAVLTGLLNAIPAQRRPRAALTWLDGHAELPERLRWWTHAPPSPIAKFIGSPVSQADFASMAANEIGEVFEKLPDQTEWHHPDSWELGGSVQASRELAKVLAQDPERAAELFERFEPGKQDRPIAYTIREWADAGQRELVLEWVRWADTRGHTSFRSELGGALAKVAEQGGLDEELCTMLERWLNEWSEDEDDPRKESEQDWDPRKAVLGEGGFILPQGSFSVLEALFLGLLRREEPDVNWALTALDTYWRFLATPMRFSAFGRYVMRLLMYFDAKRTISSILAQLQRDVSPLLSASSVTPLMALTSEDPKATALYQKVALQIRDSEWSRGAQAYAELSTWTALWRSSEWAIAFVEAMVHGERGDEQLLAGVVHVATSHVMEFSPERKSFSSALDWLVGLLPLVSDELAPVWLRPLARVRYRDEVGPAAQALLPLFKAVALRPRILAQASADLFIGANQLVHEASSYVALLTKAFLQHRVERGQARFWHDKERDALISIIAMLQRKPHQRHHALDILDALIDLKPYGFESMLSSLEALD